MRRRRKKNTLHRFLLLFSFLLVGVVGYIAFMELKPMVVKAVTIEAGSPMVDVEEFLLEKDMSGRYITDFNRLDLSIPGIYEIKIKVRNRIHTSSLEVVDNIPPEAETVDVLALKGEQVKASAFITNVTDATPVTATFATPPNTEDAGDQEVIILIEDTSLNKTSLKARLTVLDVKSSVQIEAGSVMNISPKDYMEDSGHEVSFITEVRNLDISRPVVHEILIDVDGKTLTSYIDVIDTTPPKARALDQVSWLEEELEAMAFVRDIEDVSEVSVSYKKAPDFARQGVQKVEILLVDFYGNQSFLNAIITIKKDTIPPSLLGIRDKTIYIGETISYKKGISVMDNKDLEVHYQVDSSQVNLNEPGIYPVYYTAEDLAGNKVEEVSNITVKALEVADEELNELTDRILEDIINASMTFEEKAYEIYLYVKGHVAYVGDSDKSDVNAEAFRGIRNGKGDCFTFYAVAEALLNRAGIDNMGVIREGGRTRHYWSLVNCGDGWYHFDTCPNKDKQESFMLTDNEVEEYTRQRGNNYYTFDKSLYPATPLE